MIKDVNGRFDYILFHLKLEIFHCIGVMNELKVICYGLFFCSYKTSYYFFNRQELLQKSKRRYHN